MLPDGITRKDLTALLPDGALPAAATLRHLGLAFDEGPRLRMLAPLREHSAAHHQATPPDLDRAIGHYAELAGSTGNRVGSSEGAQAVARLQAETGNITAMLSRAAAACRTAELAGALWGLTEYWKFAGLVQPEFARTALEVISAHGTNIQQASTWFAFADLRQSMSDNDNARAEYERALSLFQQAGEARGEAQCLHGLGRIALGRSDLDHAEEQFERALPLFRQAGDVLGEANCIKSLGDVALSRPDLDGAQTQFERALPLYQQIKDVLGEANATRGLGDIALERSDLDAGRALFEEALALYETIPVPYSIGWTLVGLARLEPAGEAKTRRWAAAREAWTSIGRDDLVEGYKDEFESQPPKRKKRPKR